VRAETKRIISAFGTGASVNEKDHFRRAHAVARDALRVGGALSGALLKAHIGIDSDERDGMIQSLFAMFRECGVPAVQNQIIALLHVLTAGSELIIQVSVEEQGRLADRPEDRRRPYQLHAVPRLLKLIVRGVTCALILLWTHRSSRRPHRRRRVILH
jgi:hypothetical protein